MQTQSSRSTPDPVDRLLYQYRDARTEAYGLKLDPDEVLSLWTAVTALLDSYSRASGKVELVVELLCTQLVSPVVASEFVAAVGTILKATHHRLLNILIICTQQVALPIIPMFTSFNFPYLEELQFRVAGYDTHGPLLIPSTPHINFTADGFPALRKAVLEGWFENGLLHTEAEHLIRWHGVSDLRIEEEAIPCALFSALSIATNLTICELTLPGEPSGSTVMVYPVTPKCFLPNLLEFRIIGKSRPNLTPLLNVFVLPALKKLTLGLQYDVPPAHGDICCPGKAILDLRERGGFSLDTLRFSRIGFNTERLIQVLRDHPNLTKIVLSQCIFDRDTIFDQLIPSVSNPAPLGPAIRSIMLHASDFIKDPMLLQRVLEFHDTRDSVITVGVVVKYRRRLHSREQAVIDDLVGGGIDARRIPRPDGYSESLGFGPNDDGLAVQPEDDA